MCETSHPGWRGVCEGVGVTDDEGVTDADVEDDAVSDGVDDVVRAELRVEVRVTCGVGSGVREGVGDAPTDNVAEGDGVTVRVGVPVDGGVGEWYTGLNGGATTPRNTVPADAVAITVAPLPGT